MQVLTGQVFLTTVFKKKTQQNKPNKKPPKTSIYIPVLVDYRKVIFYIASLTVAYYLMEKLCCFSSKNTYDLHIKFFSQGQSAVFVGLFAVHEVPHCTSFLSKL